jgi:hypothetical protein
VPRKIYFGIDAASIVPVPNVLRRRFGKSGAGAGLVPGLHIFLIWGQSGIDLGNDGTSAIQRNGYND